MEAKELRINNLLQNAKGDVTSVTSVFVDENGFSENLSFKCFNYTKIEVEPIPLTEKWLERLGFEKDIIDGILFYVKHNKQNTIQLHSKVFDVYVCQNNIIDSSVQVVRMKYVHELQNLYFALTGVELEVKELQITKTV